MLSAAGVGFVLSQAAAVAAVPPALTAAAVLASVGYAAGTAGGLVTTAAIATKEIQAMFLKKLIIGTSRAPWPSESSAVGVVGSFVSDRPGDRASGNGPESHKTTRTH